MLTIKRLVPVLAPLTGISLALAAANGCSSPAGDNGDTSTGAVVVGVGQTPDAGGVDVELTAQRERLLGTYLAYLKTTTAPQSNGVEGSTLTSTCDLWKKLPLAPRTVFLTLTHRLTQSTVGDTGKSMASHITKIYRIAGGDGSTGTEPGSCGGVEANRMIMSMDRPLHDLLLKANGDQGAFSEGSKADLFDVRTLQAWRDSHDLGGPHKPFDLSDETDSAAPRGQVQYFRDPASPLANQPLGRTDLETLVDPLAIEMDQDYDCTHHSNPLCSYTLYGTACFPQATKKAIEIYEERYGTFFPDWKPSGCTDDAPAADEAPAEP